MFRPIRSAAMLRRRLLLTALAGALFPVGLWVVATLFFGGDLGKYSDDWTLNLRDLATGTYRGATPFERWDYFWRPLHLIVLCSLSTAFWDADWVTHAFSSGCHGLVAYLLFRLLRRENIGWHAAAAASMAFLVHPLTYEVIIWPATVSTSIATAMFLLTASWTLRLARGQAKRSRAWLMAPWAFAIACFYEQPAGALLALPILHLAADDDALPTRARLVRALTPAMLCGLACMAYVALMLATAPEGVRGGTASFRDPARLLESALDSARTLLTWTVGSNAQSAVAGGIAHAWSAYVHVPGESRLGPGAYALGALALAALFWQLWWARPERFQSLRGPVLVPARSSAPAEIDEPPTGPLLHPWLLVLFGLAAALLSMLPAIALGITPQPRLLYFPLLCLLLSGVVALDELIRVESEGPRFFRDVARVVSGVVLAAACIAGALALVGYQSLFRTRSEMDFDQLSQLKLLVPDPPPNADFIVLRKDDRPLDTGFSAFDNAWAGAKAAPWAAWAWVRVGYARLDVRCTHWPRVETQRVLRGWNQQGVRYHAKWGGSPADGHCGGVGGVPGGGWPIRWTDAIPFIVDARGQVQLVRTIRVEREGLETLVITPPVVQALLARRSLPTTEFTLQVRKTSE